MFVVCWKTGFTITVYRKIKSKKRWISKYRVWITVRFRFFITNLKNHEWVKAVLNKSLTNQTFSYCNPHFLDSLSKPRPLLTFLHYRINWISQDVTHSVDWHWVGVTQCRSRANTLRNDCFLALKIKIQNAHATPTLCVVKWLEKMCNRVRKHA